MYRKILLAISLILPSFTGYTQNTSHHKDSTSGKIAISDTTHTISVIVLDSLHQQDTLQKYLEEDPTRYLQSVNIPIQQDFSNLHSYFKDSDIEEFYFILNQSFPNKTNKKNAKYLLKLIREEYTLLPQKDVKKLQTILYNLHPELRETLEQNRGIDNKYGYATRQAVKKLTISVEDIIQKQIEEEYTQLYLDRYEAFNTVFILIDQSGSNKQNQKFPFQLTKYLKNYLERKYNVYIREYGFYGEERGFWESLIILKQLNDSIIPLQPNSRILIELHTDEPDATGRDNNKYDSETAYQVLRDIRKYTTLLNEKGYDFTISFAFYQLGGNPNTGLVKLIVFQQDEIQKLPQDLNSEDNSKMINKILRKNNRLSRYWWWNLPLKQQYILDLKY